MNRTTLKILILCIFAVATARATADDMRTLQYTPTPDGYIKCHNGKNMYTRALYGGESLWRLETSDMPVFAAYHKTDNRNIYLTVQTPRGQLQLDSVAECTSLYRGGERIYILKDPLFDKGTITLTVVACHDADQAVWQVEATNMPKGSTITAYTCATTGLKLSRSGDLGVDPREGFAAHPERKDLSSCTIGIAGKKATKYILYSDRQVSATPQLNIQQLYEQAQRAREAVASKFIVNTPDPYINTVAASLTAAADGIWDGTSYQHGAVGWRMPLSGWRGAYAGDFLGWHDRARTHFDAYAASQVTDVPPTCAHPTQDPQKGLTRAEKRWGTPMYSNGYICRNPNRNDQMHHYDMTLCYIDELLWHIRWTGDMEYARKVWPTIQRALQWEKLNFDPDDDGLYDAYCCIWASDALYYNSGAVTHSSAYNYRANKIAAEIARCIGVDPKPYQDEAAKILQAINSQLWLSDKGVWAEYRDRMGNQQVHDHPGLWTIYHAIDSDIAYAEQAYSAIGYINDNIPHIPVKAEGLDADGYAVVSTTDWLPYAWSINNVAFAEMYHTALAMWQARRPDDAMRLLKSAMFDGMFLGDSPGNIGQVSHYDAARGECYRDFADPVGVLARTMVQGLFGFDPDGINRRVTITPGWPTSWQYATVAHSDFGIDFKREGAIEHYDLTIGLANIDSVYLRLTPLRDSVKSIKVNGVDAHWTLDDKAVGRPLLVVKTPSADSLRLEIEWDGKYLAKTTNVRSQNGEPYRELSQGMMRWLCPTESANVIHKNALPKDIGTELITNDAGAYAMVDMSDVFNADVTDIFKNRYISPRPPYTTLQIPVHGFGEWCHPDDSVTIDDKALRQCDGVFVMPQGIPFFTPARGHNIAYTSLWDNYPDQIEVMVNNKGRAANVMLAGSTNHMQCYVDNAWIDIEYADGTTTRFRLIPPYNWCPIEQAYYTDGSAFDIPTQQPYRVTLHDGKVSNDLPGALTLDKPDGHRIYGGAATILSIPLNPEAEVKTLRLTSVANDVVVGLMGLTITK